MHPAFPLSLSWITFPPEQKELYFFPLFFWLWLQQPLPWVESGSFPLSCGKIYPSHIKTGRQKVFWHLLRFASEADTPLLRELPPFLFPHVFSINTILHVILPVGQWVTSFSWGKLQPSGSTIKTCFYFSEFLENCSRMWHTLSEAIFSRGLYPRNLLPKPYRARLATRGTPRSPGAQVAADCSQSSDLSAKVYQSWHFAPRWVVIPRLEQKRGGESFKGKEKKSLSKGGKCHCIFLVTGRCWEGFSDRRSSRYSSL